MEQRDFIGAGLAGLCLLPSAVVNVLPHIQAMRETGDLPSEAGSVSFQAMAVIVMAGMPFAIKKTRDFSGKAGLFVLAVVLLFLNFLNALDLAGQARESATGVARGTLAKAAGLKSRIADLEKSRAQVPQFTFTSSAMVQAAQSAVSAAETARDTECKKVGDKCRQRQDEASAATAKFGEVTAQRELTERAEKLDTQILEAKGELLRLGPLPAHADATASRLTRIIGLVLTVDQNTDDAVAEWRPIVFAFGIELLAFLGPLGMMAAFSNGYITRSRNVLEMQQPRVSEKTKRKPKPNIFSKLDTPAREIAGLLPSPATAATLVKAKKNSKAVPAGVGDVREFFESRTTARKGHDLRTGEVYDAYKAWCVDAGREPVSLTRFGTTAKGELGIAYAERSRRGYYCNLAFKAVPLKIVSAM
jgi:hypothetical protein